MNGPFYYQHDGLDVGPLSAAELKRHATSGRLSPSDRVWTETSPKGSTARKIKGLFPQEQADVIVAEADDDDDAPTVVDNPYSTTAEATATPAVALAQTGPPAWKSALQAVLRILAIAGKEVAATAVACCKQVGRIVTHVRNRYSINSAAKEITRAQIALGEKLHVSGLGDGALRTGLEQLKDRRRSLQTAKASTKQVDAEEKGLYLRLAEPYLESSDIPAPVAAEHQQLRESQALFEAANTRFHEHQLVTPDGRSRVRVIVGSLAFLLLALVGARWMFQGEPYSDLPGAETKEVWWEESETFPRRLAVGRFVGENAWGEIKFYDEERRLMGKQEFKDGKANGPFDWNYPSGAKLSHGEYVDDQREGTVTVWFEDGSVAYTLECVKGESHGKQRLYYPNGQLFSEVENRQGKPTGKMNCYLADGRMCAVLTYENGEMVKEDNLFEATAEEVAAVDERAAMRLDMKSVWGLAASGEEPLDPGSEVPGGDMPTYTPPSGTSVCTTCNGLGQTNCNFCLGSGKNSTCYTCNGTGRAVNGLQCFTCNGTGRQNCSSCTYGRVQCPDCYGTGQR